MSSWYQGWERETRKGSITGYTLFEAIDTMDSVSRFNGPLRVPIDTVLYGKSEMVTVSGRVEAGIVETGMSVILSPANVVGDVESVQLCCNRGERGAFISLIQIRGISPKHIRRGHVISDLGVSHARETISFVSRIIFLEDCDIFAPDCNPVLYVHTTKVPCRFQEIVAMIDGRSGKVLEDKPRNLKRGDICSLRLVPSKPLCLEAYDDFPALGRFQLREGTNGKKRFSFSSMMTKDSYLTEERAVGIGIVESVERR